VLDVDYLPESCVAASLAVLGHWGIGLALSFLGCTSIPDGFVVKQVRVLSKAGEHNGMNHHHPVSVSVLLIRYSRQLG